MPFHIFYISGLGDRYDPFRKFFLRFWKLFGVSTTLVHMTWSDGLSYKEKIVRSNKLITTAKGKRIILIGESAGGSVALNLYAENPEAYYKVLTICGKNTQANRVSPHLYKKNPAFKTAMFLAEESTQKLTPEQRRAFVSIHPLIDHVVPIQQTLIPDCKEVTLWTVGHLTTIAFALTIGAFFIVRVATR